MSNNEKSINCCLFQLPFLMNVYAINLWEYVEVMSREHLRSGSPYLYCD